MDEYKVKLLAKAAYDLNNIYEYIVEEFDEIKIAENLVELIENAILSLSEMPYRGALRKNGAFANKGYRQLFVRNFTVIYRIDEMTKTVLIVTVRYTPSNF